MKDVTRLLQLEPGAGRTAKNRSVYQLPPVLENPTMRTLYYRGVLGKSLEELKVIEGGMEDDLDIRRATIAKEAPASPPDETASN